MTDEKAGRGRRIRMAAFNVEFSRNTTPEQTGETLSHFNFDVVCFNEVPRGDWTAKAGKAMGLDHSFTGAISSANHTDKYKSILCRAPLERQGEYEFENGRWNPASAVRAETVLAGRRIVLLSLHINSHQRELLEEALSKEGPGAVFAMGDYNAKLDSELMLSLERAGFRASWRDLAIDVDGSYTCNAYKPEENEGVIDHILYNAASQVRAVGGGIIELASPLSDHKPVWAEFELPT